MSGVLILIALTMTGYVFVTALGGAIILYGLLLKIYLRAAGDLKRLEGISKFLSLSFPSFETKSCLLEIES
jgi:uncharacterized membrane protein HdeD (DUF308 family)